MEDLFRRMAETIALWVEAAAALLIAVGAVDALARLGRLFRRGSTLGEKREVWLHFAGWLVLGLEFELAADVIRTAIAPSWTDIGQLAAIAGIRTLLNFFLERDIESFAAAGEQSRARRDSHDLAPPLAPVVREGGVLSSPLR